MSLICQTPSLLVHNVGHKVQASWRGPQEDPSSSGTRWLPRPHSFPLTHVYPSPWPAWKISSFPNVVVIGPHISFPVTIPLPHFYLTMSTQASLPFLAFPDFPRPPDWVRCSLLCSYISLHSQESLVMTLITLSYNPWSSYLASPPDSDDLVLITGIMSLGISIPRNSYSAATFGGNWIQY